MKLTKIFGIVLSLHVGVILLVMFQPSCQTVEKKKEPGTEVGKPPLDTNVNQFNQGSTNTGQTGQEVFVAPTRPSPGEIIIPGNEVAIPQPTESGLLVPPSNEYIIKSSPESIRRFAIFSSNLVALVLIIVSKIPLSLA